MSRFENYFHMSWRMLVHLLRALQGVALAGESGVVKAIKLYPAGATTNSQAGVTDLFGKCMAALEEMVEQGLPLLVTFVSSLFFSSLAMAEDVPMCTPFVLN